LGQQVGRAATRVAVRCVVVDFSDVFGKVAARGREYPEITGHLIRNWESRRIEIDPGPDFASLSIDESERSG
jgi:hypothetical protein